jgi:TrmH family RNA methyltransferase
MPFRIVQSKQNARLKDLRKALAHPGRDSRAVAGIEGPNLLEEALRAGLRIDCVFAAQGTEHLLEDLPIPPETEILLLPRDLLDSVLTTETPQSIAALVEPPAWSWTDVLQGHGNTAPLVVVLAGLQDPGNLGTILRSAEAFGASGIVTLPGTVSPWNPKAVRASAGSLFRLPLMAATAEECFSRLRQNGIHIFTTAVQGAKPAHHIDLAGPAALLIGNEGNGVPLEFAAQAEIAVTIPCPGPVESLNASVAAAVLLYEASRQRSSRNEKASYPCCNNKDAARVGHPARTMPAHTVPPRSQQ